MQSKENFSGVSLARINHIIITITESIALELGSTTTLLEVVDTLITFLDVCAVLAFAFLAVFVIFGTATVAAIPSTTSVVAVEEKMAWKKRCDK